jgi:hypothetical protein
MIVPTANGGVQLRGGTGCHSCQVGRLGRALLSPTSHRRQHRRRASHIVLDAHTKSSTSPPNRGRFPCHLQVTVSKRRDQVARVPGPRPSLCAQEDGPLACSSPATADQHSGSVYRVFSSITMREPWGCWAIGPRRSVISLSIAACARQLTVDMLLASSTIPRGRATDCEASFLVFVPKRGPSTFALHQPIILHGAGLKLDSSGVVTCRASVPTRVYTAITSEPELSIAIPDLGLHWFGVKEGYAFITSAAPEQPVSVHAVPLFVGPAAAERPTTVSLDLASHGLLANHPRFVIYSPLSNEVLDSDNWGSRQLHLSIGRSGGSCVVSPVYTLSTNKPSPIGKAPWGIAYVTPHTTLGSEPEPGRGDSSTETSKLEYDSETEFLSREIKPPPPSRPRMIAPPRFPQSAAYRPVLVRLLWRTVGYLVRALIMRLFGMIGLPVSPLVSYLRPAHPKSESHRDTGPFPCRRVQGWSSKAAKVEYATSEKSEGPVRSYRIR